MKKTKLQRFLLSVYDYFLFFLLVAFFISCSMMLFLNLMQAQMQITLTQENIETAAKLTFFNVLFLSLAWTLIDRIRKRILIDRQIERISTAAEQMIEGNYSVRLSAVPALLDRGHFNGIIDCFNQVARELEGSETLRSDFIANVSHELKTPLSVISNYAQLLSSDSLSAEQRAYYTQKIAETAQKMSNMVSNVLKLSKLENRHLPCIKSVFDLSEQLCTCVLHFEPVWEEKGIAVETDIAEDVLVESDPEMLKIVWNNLLSNAFKFTPNGGTVTVRLKKVDSAAQVSVIDTGCGIDTLTGKFIFDKFYQGDTSHASEGNGLGLAMVKQIIDLTGNRISVTSERGKGSTFTVEIKEIKDNGKQQQI